MCMAELIAVPPGRVRPRRAQPSYSAQEGYNAFPGSTTVHNTPVASSTPVVVPPDPAGVLDHTHSAHELLANEALVIVRYVRC